MFNLTTIKIAKNTMYQLVGKLITMCVTVFITYMVTRGYGREAYGDFSLMQGIPGLLFVITDFGLNAISVRETSKDESRIYHYFFNVLIFRVLLSALFILTLGVLLAFFPYSDSLKFGIRLSLLLILTFSLFTTTNIVFQTKLRYDLSSLSQVIGYVFIVFASGFLIHRQASVTWINFSYVIGGFLTFLVGLSFISRLDIKKNFYLDIPLIKKLFNESLPLGIMFVFSQMSFKEDILLLSLLKIPPGLNLNHSEVVGVYSLPYRIFEVSLVIPTFFMNSVYPFLVKHLEESSEKFILSFKRTLKFLIVGGILVGVLGVILSPFVVSIFGEDEFRYSVPVLRILMGGVALFYLTQPISWFLVILKRQRILPFIYLVSALVNLGLNLIIIPRYSFYGAAVVTLISELIVLVLLTLFARKVWKNRSSKVLPVENPIYA